MAHTSGQLTFDQTLFHPQAAMRAMRDSRYRHESNAIAELIDNSIDAKASHVELLLFEERERVNRNKVRRVDELAVFDDGHGMDPQTLVRALSFGGQRDDRRIHHIGKYGVGLPTASVSQCRRLDVWTWQSSIKEPWHCYLDIDEIESQADPQLPVPDRELVPSAITDCVSAAGLDPSQGTVVVWRKIDRITARAETIFQRVERDLGRIHRHFLYDGRLVIRMAAVEKDKVRVESDVRPNDPLFLMEGTSTPAPEDDSGFVPVLQSVDDGHKTLPMFAEYQRAKTFQVTIDGKAELVDVRFSMVKPEALGLQKNTPGNLQHGRAAMRNSGVSIVREERELFLEKSFVGAGARREEPQNRWWGCEVRFDAPCDDLFGVDHNKQMAAAFTDLAQEIAGERRRDIALRDDLGADHQLFDIVDHIRSTVSGMRAEIDEMFKRRRSAQNRDDLTSPIKEAEQRASQIVAEEVRLGGPRTETDRQRAEMTVAEKQAALSAFFERKGVVDPEKSAREAVEQDAFFRIEPENLPGYYMFNVVRSGGFLIVQLNINHALYRYLQFLEDQEGDQGAHEHAVALLTLVLGWARMEDEIDRDDERQHVQHTASEWGREATKFLSEHVDKLKGGEQ